MKITVYSDGEAANVIETNRLLAFDSAVRADRGVGAVNHALKVVLTVPKWVQKSLLREHVGNREKQTDG